MATTNETVRTKRSATANRARSARPATDRLRKQVKEVTEDLQDLGGAAKNAARKKLRQFRESVSDFREQGQDKVQHVEHTLENFLRARPFKSVLIAAGVGLLLGRFWMRR